jgi:hypothetical protein
LAIDAHLQKEAMGVSDACQLPWKIKYSSDWVVLQFKQSGNPPAVKSGNHDIQKKPTVDIP